MKSGIYKLAILIVLAISLTNCEEVEESPLVIFLTPQEAIIEANTNEHIFITVEARANQGNINQLIVEQKDEYSGIISIVDSSLENSYLNYTLDYIIPEYPDSTETLITFTVRDNIGNQIQAAKRLMINKGSSLISESSGHVIYSSLSDKPNAFNLANLTPGYSADLFDVDVDFMDNSVDSIDGNEISRVWISQNSLDFVQYNGFNFAMANSSMISDAYDIGIKLTKATNIQDSDVFLIGRNNNAIGAIQIISIVDADSTLNDKYMFNLKIIDSYLN